MLVHVAAGGEHPRTNVASVRPQPLRLGPAPCRLADHSVDGLEMYVEVPALRVSSAAHLTPVRPLVGVRPLVALQQARNVELFAANVAAHGGGEGRLRGGGRGPWGRR